MLVALAAQHPEDAQIQYETACVHDFLGKEDAAVAYYIAAIAGNLSGEQLRGAYVGLGSTYRVLGNFIEAERTLIQGLRHFPEANEIKVFLAMVHYNLGRSKEAVQNLLSLLEATSADASIRAYGRAIQLYAQDLDRSWKE